MGKLTEAKARLEAAKASAAAAPPGSAKAKADIDATAAANELVEVLNAAMNPGAVLDLEDKETLRAIELQDVVSDVATSLKGSKGPTPSGTTGGSFG